MDPEKLAAAVRMILEAIGESPDRDGLRDTPARVARMYQEVFGGLHENPAEHVRTFTNERYDEMILVKDISFTSMCEHHLLPFLGTAHVAYIPVGRVIGLSKVARIVDVFARRPQIQERLTDQIADFIDRELQPRGVAVVLEATHSCMSIRGVKKSSARMVTSAMRGEFRENLATRSELLNLINKPST
jgi:GTP cyclohydrolase I